MSEPPNPSEIARREFEVVRRGYDQHAVQGFLHEVGALVERLQRAEADLVERLARAESRAQAAGEPDEAAMLELLGEETTRVLTSAREAASGIRTKAEEAAERLVAEATAQAAQTRNAAVADADNRLTSARAERDELLDKARGELERRTKEGEEAASRLRAEAESEGEVIRDEARRDLAATKEEAASLIEAAKEEGRQLVADAQAMREKVLRDLAARRKRAKLQIEQLNAGRERLLQAYDVVRNTVQEATGELDASVTDARLAAAAAARRVELEPEASVAELDQEVSTARLVDLPPSAPRPAPPPEAPRSVEQPAAPEPPPLVKVPEGRRKREEERAEEERAGEAPAEAEEPAPDDSAFGPIEVQTRPKRPPAPSPELDDAAEPSTEVAEPSTEAAEPSAESAEPSTEADKPGPADAVFARLHAEVEGDASAEGEASDDGGDGEPDEATPAQSEDVAAFEARAAATEPVERDLLRRLKRTLSDEQNEVLDQLRRTKPQGLEDLLPPGEEHTARWSEVAAGALAEAAAAGAVVSGAKAGGTGDLAKDMARSLVLPLRERIDRSFAASDGNLDDVSDRVRALYREWKNQKLTETAIHYVGAAYAQGLVDGLDAGSGVRWVPDPVETACPDCDDNVLAGTLPRGEAFPTGHTCAPAHPGCHCLVLPARA